LRNKCYLDGNWIGCWGDYDHSDRGLLILAISAGITLAVYLVNKYLR
jgi:hypothetical protein